MPSSIYQDSIEGVRPKWIPSLGYPNCLRTNPFATEPK